MNSPIAWDESQPGATPPTRDTVSGEVLAIDYDGDTISVRLDDGSERTYPFEAFDAGDVFKERQAFRLTFADDGRPSTVVAIEPLIPVRVTVSGYVESVDPGDELVWVYLRDDEGWHRKVMPLELFREQGLAHPGTHFLLELDEHGTPVELKADDDELELKPLEAEEAKPRWTSRPAAEAD